MKKRAVFLVAGLILSAVTGCGKQVEDAAAVSQNKDYVYSFEAFNEKLEGHDLSQNYVTKDRMIFIEYRYEEAAVPEGDIYEEAGIAVDDIAVEEDAAIAVDDIAIEEDAAIAEEDIAIEEAEAAEEDIAAEDAEIAVEDVVIEEDAAIAVDDIAIEGAAVDIMPEEEMYMEEYVEPKSFLCVLQCDFNGNILAEFEIEQTSDSRIYNICADDSGNVYMVLCEYISEPEVYREVYSLLAYSESGEELYRIPLGTDVEEDEYYYVNQVLCGTDQNLILWSTKGIEIYKTDSTFVKTIPMENQNGGTLYLLRDGSLAMLCYGNYDQYFLNIDIETGEFSERIELPYNAYNYSHYAGVFSDFLLVDAIGVHSYNFGDEASRKIMDFVDSDLSSSYCYSVAQLTEESFFAWTYDEVLGQDICGIFTKVDPSTIQDKKILTLGTQWTDPDVRARVVEFNKNNTEYRIRIEDYSQYNTSDDYSIAQTKLNTDIASGNAPDILCLNSDMPVKSYMTKGLFADLNVFIENDPELNKEDYMQEVIDAFSQDGKWYQLVPSFYLFTILGKASEVGEEPGWTFEELQALRDTKPDDIQVLSDRTKLSVLNYSMMLNIDQFINWETGECYFKTQDFIDLLEFANEFPEEIDYEEIYNDPDYWESQETMFREGRALLMPYTLANFQDFQYCEDGTFGEQITAVGFPVSEGVGNAYSSDLSFAISAKSQYQGVAWEFLRYYLTDEYQDNLWYGWPVKLSSLDKLIAEAQKRPSYIDEFGNEVEYDDTYYLNGMDIVLEPLTQEDCDRVMNFLKSADHVYSYDSNIMTIMTEECAAYFEGQKTAEEAADIIQSRVFIYVNENL